MTAELRGDRTARLLARRLEEIASAAERACASRGAVARLLEPASIATAYAVRLELVSADRAATIWRDAASRHPVLAGAGREVVRRPSGQ
jgi:soluble lytic murein transglycosylase-like protein